MPTERPDDVVLHSSKVTSTEVAPDDHGTITVDENEVHHAEAAAELELLDDGRQRVTFLLGDAELAIVYDRESQESAERAAVLMVSLPNLLNQVEEAYDQAGEEGEEPLTQSNGEWAQ